MYRDLDRRASSAAMWLALLALVPFAAVGDRAQAQERSIAERTLAIALTRELPAATSNRYELGSGDLLRITFYKREDLSGQFRVREDNTISLPLLGKFPVEGKNAAELEQAIAATFAAGSVNVEVLERRPYYVVGAVARSGAYPFVPGMIVLNALAQAGSSFRLEETQTSLALSVLDHVNANRRHKTKLVHDQAKLERLMAERDGKELEAPSATLIALAGEEEARALIEAERTVQANRATIRAEKRSALQVEADLTGEEAKSLDRQFDQIMVQSKITKHQLTEARALDERQLFNRSRLYDLERRAAEHEGDLLRVQGEAHRARRGQAKALSSKALIDQEAHLEIENEISALQAEIATTQAALRAAETVLAQLPPELSIIGQTDGEKRISYQIHRVTANGYARIQADENTPMRPGDILRVSVTNR